MRYSEFKIVESYAHKGVMLNEGARIDHAEDIIFWEGSKGAIRALESLKKMEEGGHENVTVKWDGSPAIIFGRDANGEFILSDKSGFVAKGYDGKNKTGDAIQKMFMARPGAKNDPEGYGQLASNMKDIFDEYQKAMPKDFRGFLQGDLLYFNTPELIDGKFVFTPNIVTYKVDANSDLGKKIAQSKTGVVVHKIIDFDGNVSVVPPNFEMQGTEVLIFPSVTVSKPASIDDEDINSVKALVSKHAQAIDTLLDSGKLLELKMKDLPTIFYTYLNSKVDTGLEALGDDFMQWMQGSKISAVKQKRIAEHLSANAQGFNAMWAIITGIMQIKDKIIGQFDSHDADVTAEIGKHGPVDSTAHGQGGEGYVLTHPQGDIKLVPRAYFTKANRSIVRN
jgi:hypothetical protein